MDRFSTARLHAERLAPAHLDDLVALHQDAAVMRFVGGVRTPETTAAYLEANLRHWDERGFGLWIIRDEAGRFIGRAGVRPLDVEGVEEIEVAYTFIPDGWGKGYASEITAALVDIGFGELGLPELVGIVMVAHVASRRVLEKAGFTFERNYVAYGEEVALYRLGAAEVKKFKGS
jgi:RimJ/RimL family protein N-acetyltransferase